MGSQIDDSAQSGAGSSDGDGVTGNLTIQVVSIDARWRMSGEIQVFIKINGSLTRNGSPVQDERIRGAGTLQIHPWGPCLGGCPPVHLFKDPFLSSTGSDGEFLAGLGPYQFGPQPPPVGQPHCTQAWSRAWGIAGANDTVPYAEDKFPKTEVCTQSYP